MVWPFSELTHTYLSKILKKLYWGSQMICFKLIINDQVSFVKMFGHPGTGNDPGEMLARNLLCANFPTKM